MTEQQGLFTIPTRIYLTEDQRVQLDYVLRVREIALADLLSEVIVEHLKQQPPEPPAAEPATDIAAELRMRRTALAKLRAQRGNSAGPAWLGAYIAELETEISALEQKQE